MPPRGDHRAGSNLRRRSSAAIRRVQACSWGNLPDDECSPSGSFISADDAAVLEGGWSPGALWDALTQRRVNGRIRRAGDIGPYLLFTLYFVLTGYCVAEHKTERRNKVGRLNKKKTYSTFVVLCAQSETNAKKVAYMKGTMYFLNLIEHTNRRNRVTQGSLLVTIGVNSLYTNIPHDEGMFTAEEFFSVHHSSLADNECILRLLELILSDNNFIFDSTHYLQIHGAAMETIMSPNYANIFMAKFEESFM